MWVQSFGKKTKFNKSISMQKSTMIQWKNTDALSEVEISRKKIQKQPKETSRQNKKEPKKLIKLLNNI